MSNFTNTTIAHSQFYDARGNINVVKVDQNVTVHGNYVASAGSAPAVLGSQEGFVVDEEKLERDIIRWLAAPDASTNHRRQARSMIKRLVYGSPKEKISRNGCTSLVHCFGSMDSRDVARRFSASPSSKLFGGTAK